MTPCFLKHEDSVDSRKEAKEQKGREGIEGKEWKGRKGMVGKDRKKRKELTDTVTRNRSAVSAIHSCKTPFSPALRHPPGEPSFPFSDRIALAVFAARILEALQRKGLFFKVFIGLYVKSC